MIRESRLDNNTEANEEMLSSIREETSALLTRVDSKDWQTKANENFFLPNLEISHQSDILARNLLDGSKLLKLWDPDNIPAQCRIFADRGQSEPRRCLVPNDNISRTTHPWAFRDGPWLPLSDRMPGVINSLPKPIENLDTKNPPRYPRTEAEQPKPIENLPPHIYRYSPPRLDLSNPNNFGRIK